jgi:hypothetical protein
MPYAHYDAPKYGSRVRCMKRSARGPAGCVLRQAGLGGVTPEWIHEALAVAATTSPFNSTAGPDRLLRIRYFLVSKDAASGTETYGCKAYRRVAGGPFLALQR